MSPCSNIRADTTFVGARRPTQGFGAVPDDVLVAFDRVWVTAWGAGKVAVVDPRKFRVVRRIAVGAKPLGLIARNGAVWVGFGRGSSIARIDTATGSVERFEVGEQAPGLFVAGTRDLWARRRAATSSASTQ